MEELGMSDISDVSDPEGLSELSSPCKKNQDNSDWDDTIPKMMPRGDRPQVRLQAFPVLKYMQCTDFVASYEYE
jgi:hypothetical protein